MDIFSYPSYDQIVVYFSHLVSIGIILICTAVVYRVVAYIFKLVFSCAAAFFRFLCAILFRKKKKKVSRKKYVTEGSAATRHPQNPIIAPSAGNDWEAGGTFNPAAWHDETGKVHLVYRAVGGDGVSRLGYAESDDGETYVRLPYPIFSMENPRGITRRDSRSRRYDPVMYPSGGSWGGAEDPRMVAIENDIYITCSAFDGWDFIRIAIFKIKKQDFIEHKWKWSKVLLISPEGEIHKNWVLFPEKIEGKFAILHGITPHVQIDYVEHLEDLAYGGAKIQSKYTGEEDRRRWDRRIRGVGAPPVKTKYGWLVLYHANDHESHKYKVGALLLDSLHPEKVVARSPGPILAPDMWYENEGKPGIVYVCGAVLEEGMLYIYYGGGDKYVCVAQIPEDHLLSWIMNKHAVL